MRITGNATVGLAGGQGLKHSKIRSVIVGILMIRKAADGLGRALGRGIIIGSPRTTLTVAGFPISALSVTDTVHHGRAVAQIQTVTRDVSAKASVLQIDVCDLIDISNVRSSHYIVTVGGDLAGEFNRQVLRTAIAVDADQRPVREISVRRSKNFDILHGGLLGSRIVIVNLVDHDLRRGQ